MEKRPETIFRPGCETETSKERIRQFNETKWNARSKKLEEKIKKLPKEEQEKILNEFEELKKISTENGGILEMDKWDENKKRRYIELTNKFKDIL